MRFFRLLAMLGIMAGGMGCGLPDSFFLQPPAVGIQASLLFPEYQIVGTDRGSDTGAKFQGYELYYKFYGQVSETTSDAQSFGTGSTYTDLQQAGFHRLCLGPGTPISGVVADTGYGFASAPLVNIAQIDSGNISQSYTVRIRLNDLSTPVPPAPQSAPSASLSYYVYVPPGASTALAYEEVRRFVTVPIGSGCKTFASNQLSGITNNYDPNLNDFDLSVTTGTTIWNEVTANSPHNIIVMIYALSYGKSIVDGSPIYSSPVLLGYAGILVITP